MNVYWLEIFYSFRSIFRYKYFVLFWDKMSSSNGTFGFGDWVLLGFVFVLLLIQEIARNCVTPAYPRIKSTSISSDVLILCYILLEDHRTTLMKFRVQSIHQRNTHLHAVQVLRTASVINQCYHGCLSIRVTFLVIQKSYHDVTAFLINIRLIRIIYSHKLGTAERNTEISQIL